MNKREINLLYVLEIFSGLARGSYLGCIGWTALSLSNSVETVGQIVIAQSLSVVICGQFIGVAVDRYQRKNLIVIAQTIIAISMFSMSILLFSTTNLSVVWLFCIAIIVSVSRFVYESAFDGILKDSVNNAGILQVVARTGSIHMVATAIGMAGIGFSIDRWAMGHGFIISGAVSVFLVIVASFLAKHVHSSEFTAQGLSGFWLDFKAGYTVFKNNRSIQGLAMLSAIALPIGQLADAILPALIRNDLGRSSAIYGLVDAGWAIGGMLAAIIISTVAKKVTNTLYVEYIMAILAGFATIGITFFAQTIYLALLHALMGFFVWSCRILINSKIIELCDSSNIGRIKVYVDSLFYLSAAVMCISPSLISFSLNSSYFILWGAIIIIVTILLMYWNSRYVRWG